MRQRRSRRARRVRGLWRASWMASLCAMAVSAVVAVMAWVTMDAGRLGESVQVMGGLAAGLLWGGCAVLASATAASWVVGWLVSSRDVLEEEFVMRERQRVLTRAQLRGALYVPEDGGLDGALSLDDACALP